MIPFIFKYKIYRLLLGRKVQKAIEAEAKAVAKYDPKQREFYNRVRTLIVKEGVELYHFDGHIVIKDQEGVIVTIDLFVNVTVIYYTVYSQRGVSDLEIRYYDRTGYFLLEEVERVLSKRHKALIEQRREMVRHLYE